MKKLSSAKEKMQMFMLMMLCGPTAVMAQNSAGDYSAGTTALATVTEEIAKYVKIMMVVGACIFLIAAAQALPLFFGIGG